MPLKDEGRGFERPALQNAGSGAEIFESYLWHASNFALTINQKVDSPIGLCRRGPAQGLNFFGFYSVN